MLIPNKFNGYQAGIRLYPSGGGGGGLAAPQTSQEAMSRGMATVDMQGRPLYGGDTNTSNTSQLTVDQGPKQPPSHSIYNPQYNNYATTNPLGISQYGGYGGYGGGYGGYGGGYGGMPQMQTPFNPYNNKNQSPFSYGGGQQLPQNMYGGVYGGMGGAPAFFNYAEGGITSLLDNDE